MIKNWNFRFSNSNCRAPICFQLQHGLKTKPTNPNQTKSPQNSCWKETLSTKRAQNCSMTADRQHYILRLHDSPNSGWLEDSICITITKTNGSPWASSVCTSPLSHWLTAHSQPVQRISIRIEITLEIHRLPLTRLGDPDTKLTSFPKENCGL